MGGALGLAGPASVIAHAASALDVSGPTRRPHVIRVGPDHNDFWGIHKYNERCRGAYRYDPPGINIHLEYGADVYAPVPADVHDARFWNESGNELMLVAGVFAVWLSHLKDMEPRRGDRIERGQRIGTEGDTGAYAVTPHVAVRLCGNALIPNDINLITRTVRGEPAPDMFVPRRDLTWSHLNDPARFTPDGAPFEESAWDGRDLDGAYAEAVALVDESMAKLIADYGATTIGEALRKETEAVLSDRFGPYRPHRVHRLNTIWLTAAKHIRAGGIDTGKKSWHQAPWEFVPDDATDPLLRQVYTIVQDANTAAAEFRMTSPFRA
jgi:hypothetical protein